MSINNKCNSSDRVVVTGAAGWIGRAVCRYLLSKGKHVIALDRAGSIGEWSEFIAIDITSDAGMSAAVTSDLVIGSGVLIHCAGYAHRPVETPDEVERFFSINSHGTRRIVELCDAIGISRLVYLSSIAFYDWEGLAGQPATEDAQLSPLTSYARSKLDGETIVRESSSDWRVVRLATVFGDGDRANFSRMARALKNRMFPIPGKGDARKTVIPLDLAAELIADFCLLDNPPHRLINVGLPSSPSLDEITEAYHEICGFPRCFRLPLPAARLMGVGGSLAAKILGKFPFTSDTLWKLTTDTVVSVDRMLECFPEKEYREFDEYLERCASYYSNIV